MTTWAYPVSTHPWFRMPSHKRKAYDLDASSSDSSDLESYSAPAKRRRCDVLENGLAHLSLDHAAEAAKIPYTHLHRSEGRKGGPRSPSPQPLPGQSWNAYNHSTLDQPTHDIASIVLPSSVEEPTSPETISPDLLDVTMKSRSWYEPEKDRKCTLSATLKQMPCSLIGQASL
jgi:hypothetical protein